MMSRQRMFLFVWGLMTLALGMFLLAERAVAEDNVANASAEKKAPSNEPADAKPLDSSISHTDVFRSGKDGYHTFRIPAIVCAKDGTLLAFAEGRKNNRSDSGDIDVVLRRSSDNGKTWGPLQIVADHGEGCVGNPCPVVDQKSGDVILVTIRQTPGATEHSIRSGEPGHRRDYFVQRSTDNGKTWSEPEPICVTDPLKPRWVAGGPNHALQLRRGEHAGRILVAGNHCTGPGFDTNALHVIYSDDGGKTWCLGAVCPASDTVHPGEVAAAELPDGTILFTIRDQNESEASSPNRAFGISRDGGESFAEPLTLAPTITAPICHGSILEFSAADQGDKENRLFISYPNDAKQRKNLCVRESTDGGKTWGECRTIYPDSAAYSDLVRTADGHLGVLYERDNYGRITFALVK